MKNKLMCAVYGGVLGIIGFALSLAVPLSDKTGNISGYLIIVIALSILSVVLMSVGMIVIARKYNISLLEKAAWGGLIVGIVLPLVFLVVPLTVLILGKSFGDLLFSLLFFTAFMMAVSTILFIVYAVALQRLSKYVPYAKYLSLMAVAALIPINSFRIWIGLISYCLIVYIFYKEAKKVSA